MLEKRETSRKVFAVLLLSVFMFSLIFAAIVAAQEVLLAPLDQPLLSPLDPVKSMFTDWTEGKLSENVAKYLFFVLLAMVIYLIISIVPVIGTNKFLSPFIALVVAFLSTAYLTPQSVVATLLSYQALGITLGGIIPFIILVFFSTKMWKEGAGGKIVAYVLWVLFSVFLVYRIVAGFINDEITTIATVAYGVVILLSLVMIFGGGKWLARFVLKQEMEDLNERAQEATGEIIVGGNMMKKIAEGLAPPDKKKGFFSGWVNTSSV